MEHCSTKIKPYDEWFLYDCDGSYNNRILKLGICPICGCDISELNQTRILDGVRTKQVETKNKAILLKEICKTQKMYSIFDIPSNKKVKVSMPRTIRYGENKSVKIGNKNKVRQRAVDFYGNKELIREV